MKRTAVFPLEKLDGSVRRGKKKVLECVTALLGFGNIIESLGCTY